MTSYLVPISVFLVVTAEALGAKIDRKSAISLQRGEFNPKFQVEGVAPPPIIICTDSYANECLTTLLLTVFSFHTKKLCSRFSSSEVRF